MVSGAFIGELILWIIVAVIVIAVIYWVMQYLYRRSMKEVAFVRTGFLGQKVVIDGGAFVWPIIHDITPVNMNTLPLRLERTRQDALISKDRTRIDMQAEFYVHVRPDKEAVATAASTLGRRTLEPERLHALLAGKFESALRAVAGEMTMSEMHEQRAKYVARVRDVAQEDLAKNGLELESVPIMDIDQTPLEYFNPSNRFDAEGLTALIRDIEERRKLRNDIEQSSMIAIRARNLEAEREALEIERQSEEARLTQEQEIVFRRAQQRAELARERAARETDAEQAQITAREAIEQARIVQERAIAEAWIAKEEEIQRREIVQRKAVEAEEIAAREALEKLRIAETAAVSETRIAEHRRIRELEIERTRAIEAAEIAAQEAVEAARIAHEKALAAERIAAEVMTREREIARDKALDEARVAAQEAVGACEISRERELGMAEIARRKAVEEAEQARIVAPAGRRAEAAAAEASVRQAQITAQREVETAEVERARVLEAARIERRRSLEQLEIARMQALRAAEIESREDIERARIASERGLDEVRIGHETERRWLEIERERIIETVQLEKAIALARKSLEESAARIEADQARARAAEAEERSRTVRETEMAARRQKIDLLLAEKAAAEVRIAAEAEKVRRAVEAEAQRLMNEAENVLTDMARASLFRRKLLEHVEGIVAASVKPLEKIREIKIMQLDGLNGGGEGRSGSPTDEVITSALRYRVQAPLIDGLLSDIGIEGGNLAKQGGLIREAADMQRIANEARKSGPKPEGGEGKR